MAADLRDGTLPDYAVRQIRIKARSLVGHYGFTRSDQPDIKQELEIEVWRRRQRYDSSKGSLEKFIYWVIEKAAATIVEHQRAGKRYGGHRLCSLNTLIQWPDGKCVSASEVVEETEGGRRLGVSSEHFTDQCDRRSDVRDFVKHLPAELRDLGERLLDGQSFTDISREAGIPRGTLYERREEIRSLAEQAGLPNYLHGSGALEGIPVDHG